jgi:two-component system, OmpR family, response regulator
MPQILLIDDDATLSGMLVEYLTGEGFSTTASFSGEDGLRAISAVSYDAVILDVMLPNMNGIDVLRHIRQTSAVPVIMLTAKGDDVDRVVGLELGADDYVAKPYYARELVARLRAVLRRQDKTPPQAGGEIIAGDLSLHSGRREVSFKDSVLTLTAAEFDMLEILLEAKDLVATKNQLSQKSLGRKWQPYDRSVDVHIWRMRKKLNIASNGAIEIETVRGVGYRLRTRP